MRIWRSLPFHEKMAEIEEVVRAHLPPEARRFPNWWANQKTGKRSQAFAWMAAGWLVSEIDVDADLVKFSRQNVEPRAFTPCSVNCPHAIAVLTQWRDALETCDPEAAEALRI